MGLKLELTSEEQAGLQAQALQDGLPLKTYAEKVLRERVLEGSGPTLARSQAAGKRIRELRKGVNLGGFPLKDMIETGRE